MVKYPDGTTEKALMWMSLAFLLMGILGRIVSWSFNKTLFLDEAYVASTVVQRDYSGLFLPMDYQQGAPLGFLLAVKTLVYLFGSSEFTLRAWSLLTGLGSIGLFYLILKKRFSYPFPLAGTEYDESAYCYPEEHCLDQENIRRFSR